MKYQETIDFIKNKTSLNPKIALILGTGLSETFNDLDEKIELDFSEIPHFKETNAPTHSGKLIFGKINNLDLVVMNGRLHYYEGYTPQEITYPIRIFKKLGVEFLFVTNASGSLREKYSPGEVVCLEDHINFMGMNPLRGDNEKGFGVRFPSLHEPYDKKLRNRVKKISKEENINVKSGVYVAVSGPSLETKAECRMFQSLGADLVGMSTVPEILVSVHCGMRNLVLSVVSNYSNLFHDKRHTIEEIKTNTAKAQVNLKKIILRLIENISKGEI